MLRRSTTTMLSFRPATVPCCQAMISTSGGMRRILKKEESTVDYIRKAVDTGVYRTNIEIDKMLAERAESTEDIRTIMTRFRQDVVRGTSIHDYPFEYEIQSRHPPIPEPPRIPVKLQKRMAAAAQVRRDHHPTRALVRKILQRDDAKAKQNCGAIGGTAGDKEQEQVEDNDYYQRLFGIDTDTASAASGSTRLLGQKASQVQKAYAKAIKQYELIRTEGLSEHEALAKVDALLSAESTLEHRRATTRTDKWKKHNNATPTATTTTTTTSVAQRQQIDHFASQHQALLTLCDKTRYAVAELRRSIINANKAKSSAAEEKKKAEKATAGPAVDDTGKGFSSDQTMSLTNMIFKVRALQTADNKNNKDGDMQQQEQLRQNETDQLQHYLYEKIENVLARLQADTEQFIIDQYRAKNDSLNMSMMTPATTTTTTTTTTTAFDKYTMPGYPVQREQRVVSLMKGIRDTLSRVRQARKSNYRGAVGQQRRGSSPAADAFTTTPSRGAGAGAGDNTAASITALLQNLEHAQITQLINVIQELYGDGKQQQKQQRQQQQPAVSQRSAAATTPTTSSSSTAASTTSYPQDGLHAIATNVFDAKPHVIEGMIRWAERLRAVPYEQWTVGATTALDHWIACSLLGVSEETWATLLDGTDDTLLKIGRDIVYVRETMFPETCVIDDQVVQAQQQPQPQPQHSFGGLQDDGACPPQINEEVESSIKALIESLDHNIGKGGGDKKKTITGRDGVGSEVGKGGEQQQDGGTSSSWNWTTPTTAAEADAAINALTDELQSWRQMNADIPYEQWSAGEQGRFDSWIRNRYLTTLAQASGAGGGNMALDQDQVDVVSTREALLSRPPTSRAESDAFWDEIEQLDGSGTKDGELAEQLLDRMLKDGPPPGCNVIHASFWNPDKLSRKEQVARLMDLGAVRPLLDEYVDEASRRDFLNRYGDLLMRGVDWEHLVFDPNGPISLQELSMRSNAMGGGNNYEELIHQVRQQAGELGIRDADLRFRLEVAPYGGTGTAGSSGSAGADERSFLLYQGWNTHKANRARYEEELFKTDRLALRYGDKTQNDIMDEMTLEDIGDNDENP